MNAWWRAFYGRFSKEECAKIVEYGLTHNPVDGTIGHGGTKSVVDPGFRQSTVRWFKRSDTNMLWVYERLNELMLEANEVAFGFDIAGFRSVQFTEYDGAKQGKYDWHEDNCWKGNSPYDRKLSMVVQLTDTKEYEGGKLELANDPFPDTVFANQGDVIVFPSFNRHRVLPVTSGKRFSLVTWFVGPRFK